LLDRLWIIFFCGGGAQSYGKNENWLTLGENDREINKRSLFGGKKQPGRKNGKNKVPNKNTASHGSPRILKGMDEGSGTWRGGRGGGLFATGPVSLPISGPRICQYLIQKIFFSRPLEVWKELAN
jgi:hypothetical protein